MTRATALVVTCLACAATALPDDREDALRRDALEFNSAYERAQLARDVAFFDAALADDYTASYETGTSETRAEYLAEIRRQSEKPTYRLLSTRSENVTACIAGSAVVLTGDWIATTSGLDAGAQPLTSRGRYTSVLEKREGRWRVVAEHMSRRPRDRALAKQQVLEAGRRYNDLMKRLKSGREHSALVASGDIAALERVLADEYTYTSRDGVLSTKAEDLESYEANRVRLESAEILEQDVRVIGDDAAVETGAIRYRGEDGGRAFEITKRYTTTWVRRGGRWQIVADHTSKSAVPERRTGSGGH